MSLATPPGGTLNTAPSAAAARGGKEGGSATAVAAIVPRYNDPRESVERTVSAVLGQTRPVAQVVVVDDGSERPLEIAGDRASTLQLAENGGVSAARNQGAGVTGGDYLLFTNTDVALAPDWVERAVAFMDAHPNAGAVSGRIIPAVGRRVLRDWRLQHIETKVHRSEIGGPMRVEWLVGHVMFVRRTAFDEVGGFDPRYRRAGDDPDLCQRLSAAGHDNYHLPDLVATSYERASVDALARKCVRNSGWNLRRNCAPCAAVKPLRRIPASISALKLLGVHAARDLARGRFRFLPVDAAVACRSLALIWRAA